MRNYEVTFIVDPILSGDEIKSTAQKYVDHLQNAGCKIVHINEMGLKQLAYAINRRTTGIYYCIEFEAENGTFIAPMELQMRRDEQLLRFLTVSLDKYGVKYNQDKRDGKIGKAKKPVKKQKGGGRNQNNRGRNQRSRPQSGSRREQAPRKEQAPAAKAPPAPPAPKKEAAPAPPATPPAATKEEEE